MRTSIGSKGQLIVSKSVRDALHLKPGDTVQFSMEPDGSARFAPVRVSVRTLKGILPKPARARTLAEMREAIMQGATEQ